MKKTSIAFMIAAALSVSSMAMAQTVKYQEEVVKTDAGIHLVVKFKDQYMHQSLRATPETTKQMKMLGSASEIASFAADHNVNAAPVDAAAVLMPLAMTTGLELAHTRSASLGYDEIAVKGQDVAAAIAALMSTGQFASVEPVYMYHEASANLNDPMLKDQFYLRPYAPRFKSGSDFDALHSGFNNQLGRKIRFAIIDSGSWEHEDVQFAQGYNFVNDGIEPGRGRGPNSNARYTKTDGTTCESSPPL